MIVYNIVVHSTALNSSDNLKITVSELFSAVC